MHISGIRWWGGKSKLWDLPVWIFTWGGQNFIFVIVKSDRTLSKRQAKQTLQTHQSWYASILHSWFLNGDIWNFTMFSSRKFNFYFWNIFGTWTDFEISFLRARKTFSGTRIAAGKRPYALVIPFHAPKGAVLVAAYKLCNPDHQEDAQA